MSRITPDPVFHGCPCSIVAVGCAVGGKTEDVVKNAEGLKDDGYLTLDNMNCYIRSLLPIKKKQYFRRGERPVLTDFLKDNKRRAVVCLLGHYVYIDGPDYWSFFKNEYDDVVCVWWIRS